MNIRARLWLTIALASVAAFASPTTAAKGPARATICGVSGCAVLQGHDELHPLSSWWSTPFSQRRAPMPAPFFRIVVRQETPAVGKQIIWTLLYVPRRNAMRITQSVVPPYSTGIGPYWRTIPPRARVRLSKATKDVTPFRGSRWRP